ncbi:hypothetical protein [Gilvimarinus chinensis]|uniref:hypothetical protein n=1 Tax=Gilvimarinus chinensis TaxID=396005 RepID=UPI00036FF017|nr:hypothetical protein [Gilvimarinus chinensis]
MITRIQRCALSLALVLVLCACGEQDVANKSSAAQDGSHSHSVHTAGTSQQVRGKPSLNVQLLTPEFTVAGNGFEEVELQLAVPRSEESLIVSFEPSQAVDVYGELTQQLAVVDGLVRVPTQVRVKHSGRHHLNVLVEMLPSSGLSKRSFAILLVAGDEPEASNRQLKVDSAPQKVILPAQETVY